MADPAEEQASEIEALEAIYGDDFEQTEGSNPARFSIKIAPESGDGTKVQLTIAYTANYPNEPPHINVQPLSNISKDKTETISKLLLAEAEQSTGAVMVFTLVSKLMEYLENMPSATQVEEEPTTGLKKPKIDESVVFKHGTQVTKENFLEWKIRFDQERATWGEAKRAARAKEMELKKDRVTGRQFFARVSAANANIDWDLFTGEDEDLDDMDFDDGDEDADA